jgi:hypothetical protein
MTKQKRNTPKDNGRKAWLSRTCKICGKKFPTKEILLKHEVGHTAPVGQMQPMEYSKDRHIADLEQKVWDRERSLDKQHQLAIDMIAMALGRVR